MNFSENFKKQRIKLNMTQKQLGEELSKISNISEKTVKGYEQNTTKPTLDKLEVLMKFFNLTDYNDLLK